MKKFSIKAEYVKKMMKAAKNKGKNDNNDYEDLVKRQYNQVTERYTVLYVDITYLILKGRTAYKNTIIDGYTREVIASDINFSATAVFVCRTLKRALRIISKEKSLNGIIIHSDHGVQYTSNLWKNVCKLNNIIISMGAKKTCADNIVIESYHAKLKKGTLHNNKYKTLECYIQAVVKWDIWHNSKKNEKLSPNIKFYNNQVYFGASA